MVCQTSVWLGSSWWRHQMKAFPRYCPFMRGIHRSPVNSPHKGQWRGALMFSLICVWINGWENNREAGDLRRHRTHYDVIVMWVRPDICATIGFFIIFSMPVCFCLSSSLHVLGNHGMTDVCKMYVWYIIVFPIKWQVWNSLSSIWKDAGCLWWLNYKFPIYSS